MKLSSFYLSFSMKFTLLGFLFVATHSAHPDDDEHVWDMDMVVAGLNEAAERDDQVIKTTSAAAGFRARLPMIVDGLKKAAGKDDKVKKAASAAARFEARLKELETRVKTLESISDKSENSSSESSARVNRFKRR